jgi:hypothetical protein
LIYNKGMTILWDTYCKTMAQVKVYFRMPDGMEVVMPEAVKPVSLSMSMIESGRGTTGLAGAYNFHAMKYRDDILVKFPIGKFPYNGGDGLYDYCACRTLREEIITWWAFMHRAPYAGVNWNESDPRKLVDSFGKSYCPPGYEGSPAHAKWVQTTGFETYADYVLSLLPEAIRELKKYGWEGEDIVPPIVLPNPIPPILPDVPQFTISNGMLMGPNVHRYLMSTKYHPHRKMARVDGIVIHATGCHAGHSNIKVDGLNIPGMVEGWNAAGQCYPHIVNLRNGEIWQVEDLSYQADQCYGYNPYTYGIENENAGGFYSWQEVLGWFFRFKGKPWEQMISKSDLVFLDGKYREAFTEIQILNAIGEALAIRTAYNPNAYIKPHSAMPNQTGREECPGPLWPWDRMPV